LDTAPEFKFAGTSYLLDLRHFTPFNMPSQSLLFSSNTMDVSKNGRARNHWQSSAHDDRDLHNPVNFDGTNHTAVAMNINSRPHTYLSAVLGKRGGSSIIMLVYVTIAAIDQ